MSQTRMGSMVEAVVNVIVGFGVSYSSNALIFPLFGWVISPGQNLTLGAIFTAISLIRSFLLRRLFNAMRFGNARRSNA